NNPRVKGRATVATIICDPGEYYESTYFNSNWINKMFAADKGMDGLNCWKKVINKSIENGLDFLEEGLASCPRSREKQHSEDFEQIDSRIILRYCNNVGVLDHPLMILLKFVMYYT
ncbi:hypothetical protein TELCIR_14171, partial [Teladorsagia circumcincta]